MRLLHTFFRSNLKLGFVVILKPRKVDHMKETIKFCEANKAIFNALSIESLDGFYKSSGAAFEVNNGIIETILIEF